MEELIILFDIYVIPFSVWIFCSSYLQIGAQTPYRRIAIIDKQMVYGQLMLEAIIGGQQDPDELAKLADP